MATETELKLRLSDPNELDALLAVLPEPDKVVEQRNCYFVDPDGVLADARIMVRVREKRRPGQPEPTGLLMTLKRKRQAADGVFVADEHEQPVDPTVWQGVLAGDASLLDAGGPALAWLADQCTPRALQLQGAMTNLRRVIPYEGFTLEVDRTEFPDGTIDAEVECETEAPEQARAHIQAAATRAGVHLSPETRTKYQRFLARLPK